MKEISRKISNAMLLLATDLLYPNQEQYEQMVAELQGSQAQRPLRNALERRVRSTTEIQITQRNHRRARYSC